MNIPPIFIDENPQAEIEIFYCCLHDTWMPWMKGRILENQDFNPKI